MGLYDDTIALEEVRIDVGFVAEDVETGTSQFAGFEGLDQTRFVDDGASGGIDEEGSVFHCREFGVAD